MSRMTAIRSASRELAKSASSASLQRSAMRSITQLGKRVRDLPITLDKLLT